jgi:hypothetical protein
MIRTSPTKPKPIETPPSIKTIPFTVTIRFEGYGTEKLMSMARDWSGAIDLAIRVIRRDKPELLGRMPINIHVAQG